MSVRGVCHSWREPYEHADAFVLCIACQHLVGDTWRGVLPVRLGQGGGVGGQLRTRLCPKPLRKPLPKRRCRAQHVSRPGDERVENWSERFQLVSTLRTPGHDGFCLTPLARRKREQEVE